MRAAGWCVDITEIFSIHKTQVRRGPKAIHHPLKPRCSACLAAPVEAKGAGGRRMGTWSRHKVVMAGGKVVCSLTAVAFVS